ncbi:MAG: thiamine-phosphate kinase [Planctomycetes bacterium]|nr:thiamine-phosphate kinase [Planctomycetota bacterium]
MANDDTNKGEFALIDLIRRRAAASDAVPVGIGDDCAVLDAPGGPVVITTDMIIEGVHFEETDPLLEVGWKATCVSFSDIAAMGLRPTALLCAAALPEGFSMQQAEEIFRGINHACTEFGVALVGGDTTSSTGPLSLCTTALGKADGHLKPLLRSGAQEGDTILVTGSLGGSILGKHLTFRPRVDEAVALNDSFDVHAMIDISDGLAADLTHIIEESNLGAIIEADKIPTADAAHELARHTGKTPLQHALSDGEDFELLFTMHPDAAARLLKQPAFEVPVSAIGRIIDAGLFIELDGQRRPLEPKGYEHFK